MSFLLDTNICSAHMKRPAGLVHRFFQHSGNLHIASVTLAELYSGAFTSMTPNSYLTPIQDLLQEVTLLHFDDVAAWQYGQLSGQLKKIGIVVNAIDKMIASIALIHNLTLITHNTADFQNIPGLRLDDWLVP
jgi:tRNA(fMet)-specific endonuclease VapC